MSSIFAVLVGSALMGLMAALLTGLMGMGSLDPERLTTHRNLALAGSILVVLTHSIVFVYMIGTGRAIKDAVNQHGIDAALYEQHCAYKWRAAPWALCATVSVVATAVLGGVVDAGSAATWLHPLVALLAVLVNVGGLPAEWRTIRDNGLLLDQVAEATANQNREILDRGEDPAPPASYLSGGGWGLVLALSAWLPWLYMRFIMNRIDISVWPFAAISALGVIAFVRTALRRA